MFSLTSAIPLTPGLSPAKLKVSVGREVLLDGVVGPLDEHILEARALQDVSHRRAQSKRVNRPTIASEEGDE